jgi:ArsR family metal-binding transcriptional regulator
VFSTISVENGYRKIGQMNQTAFEDSGYSFTLVNIDCLRESTHFNVVMRLETSIEELLPYLAACLTGCTYVHGSGVINLMDAGHIIAIYPAQITMTDVRSAEEAAALCRSYHERILNVQAERNTITPLYEARPTLGVLDIYRMLPRTNCGICRLPTCMAFAARVQRREGPIADCTPLLADIGQAETAQFFEQMRRNGYETPALP